MSWTGIKKAINRAGVQVMLKTGAIEETVDLEYDFEEKRLRNMEHHSKMLQKQTKQYLDSLKILNNAQLNIGELLNSFYGTHESKQDINTKNDTNNTNNSTNNTNTNNSKEDAEDQSEKPQNFSQLYYTSVKAFSETSLQELEAPYYQTVINPISRFNSYYVEINEAIKKRAHKKLDYEALKNKVRKLIEKPSSSEDADGKLRDFQHQLVASESVYNELNEKLKNELPKLISLRIPYLDPSFESFVKLQLRFFNENYQHLNHLQNQLDAKTRQEYAAGTLDKKLDNVLDRMRELNITGS